MHGTHRRTTAWDDVHGQLHSMPGCDCRWFFTACRRRDQTSRQRSAVVVCWHHHTAQICVRMDAVNASRFIFFHGRSCLITRSAMNGIDTNRETTSPWSEMISVSCTEQADGWQSRRVITRLRVLPAQWVGPLTAWTRLKDGRSSLKLCPSWSVRSLTWILKTPRMTTWQKYVVTISSSCVHSS